MAHKISSSLRRLINFLLSFFIAAFLLLSAAYAMYALWDNGRIYQDANNVQADMIKLKPKAAEEEGPGFEELLAVNPNVRAWLTMDNTNIDYPILQGESNLSYINKDVYGDFALSGSIFLDSLNSPDFSDPYNLLYGHHMDGGRMFGDLDKYKDEKFFNENPAGTLLLPDRSYELEVFAVLVQNAGERRLFMPLSWNEYSRNSMLDYVAENALFLREKVVEDIKEEELGVISLSTCSGEFTDARTVVLAAMRPYAATERDVQNEKDN